MLGFWVWIDIYACSEVLNLLLPHVSAFVLAQTNENGSPPIHWAVLNNHVACVKALVELPEDRGGGLPILKVTIVPLVDTDHN